MLPHRSERLLPREIQPETWQTQFMKDTDCNVQGDTGSVRKRDHIMLRVSDNVTNRKSSLLHWAIRLLMAPTMDSPLALRASLSSLVPTLNSIG